MQDISFPFPRLKLHFKEGQDIWAHQTAPEVRLWGTVAAKICQVGVSADARVALGTPCGAPDAQGMFIDCIGVLVVTRAHSLCKGSLD